MCERMIGVFGGRPLMFTTNVAVPAVMLPELSRVTSNVIVELPWAPASAFEIGGTSLDDRRSAEKINRFAWLGAVLPQPAATRANARQTKVARFIIQLLCERSEQGRDHRRVAANGGRCRTVSYPDRKPLRTASSH